MRRQCEILVQLVQVECIFEFSDFRFIFSLTFLVFFRDSMAKSPEEVPVEAKGDEGRTDKAEKSEEPVKKKTKSESAIFHSHFLI